MTGNEVAEHLPDSDHIIPDFESDLLREVMLGRSDISGEGMVAVELLSDLFFPLRISGESSG